MIVKRLLLLLAVCLVFLQAFAPVSRVAAQQPVPSAAAASSRALLDKYCVGCHNGRTTSGKLRLDTADVGAVGEQSELWEKVVRKFGAGMMPPPGPAPRPDKASAAAFSMWLENELERAAVAHPNPGRTETLHRLNRTEYRNAVRDLLGLDMDFSDLLPIDDSGGGNADFDNIATSLRLTQSLMEQYLSVALKVSRLAVGGDPPFSEVVYKTPPGTRQDVYVEGLPFGTRGGLLVNHFFPVDGEYELQVGAGAGRGQIDFAVDGQRVQVLSAAAAPRAAAVYDPDGPPAAASGSNRTLRLPMKAGPRQIAVAFIKSEGSILTEADRVPFIGGGGFGAGGAGGGGPRLAGVDSLTIRGPLSIVGKGDTPTRRRIFVCRPATPAAEEGCAKTIFSNLARRAYRRPITDHDVALLTGVFKEGRAGADFEAGIERGIRAMLVNPNFLFRVEADPPTAANQIYRINDVELASRLSFFLWSSIPDDELLDLAIKGRLKEPAILEQQTRRMLKDSRASALTDSFAAQWLRIRNVQAASPVETIFPNFEESLRSALKREMELFFESIVREDRSVVDLLNADYTYLNERLAKHYGISGVVGTEFQRVQLSADSPRRGLLGKGELLLVTSRSTRTSPVSRGKWILENILGTPPPPPPPVVPPLPEQKQSDGRVLTVRELMARHRADSICASCHSSIDPAGFALEQFDAVGRWRTVDAGFQPIDASGVLPDGSKFSGINEFRALILERRDQFVRTLSEKLLMYALGRGTEFYDGPAIRKIAREAETGGYKFSSVVLGIVKSTPFQMRKVGADQTASAAH